MDKGYLWYVDDNMKSKIEELHNLLNALGLAHLLMIFIEEEDEDGDPYFSIVNAKNVELLHIDLAADQLADIENRLIEMQIADAEKILKVELPEINVDVDVTDILIYCVN